jgi:hypothetical protein
MQLSEKEIEDFIFEDVTHNAGITLANRGFQTFHNELIFDHGTICRARWLRQVDLGPYGRADIIGYYRLGGQVCIELMELKAVPIGVGDFDQIFKYKKAIKHYFGERFDLKIQLYLIGTGVSSGHYIHNELPVSVYTYTYDLDGVTFRHRPRSWHRPDGDNFNSLKLLKDAKAVY